jgi:hypothetical protein
MITTKPAVGLFLVLASMSSTLSGCWWHERHDRDVYVEPRRDRPPEHREDHPEHHDDDKH